VFRRQVVPAPEVFTYFTWFVWATLGAAVAVVPELFWPKWFTVLQIWVLIVVISGFTDNRRILSLNLAMFLVAAAMVGGYSLVTGEFQSAAETGERVEGMAMNANAFGILMTMATVCMAYFWMQPTRRSAFVKYGILLAAMAGAAIAIVLSGSRKSLLGLVLFYALWLFLCYRREIVRRGQVLLVVLLGVGIGGYGLVTFAAEMGIGSRMLRTWQYMHGDETALGAGQERVVLYREAGRIIGEHPVMGVGLDHYKVHTAIYGASAHSESAEVASNTGLIGAFVYFLWYFVLWRRAGKIVTASPDPLDRRNAGLIRATILLLLALGLGSWFFTSKTAWVIMAGFIGYTHAVWSRIRQEAGVATGYPVGP